MTKRRRINLRGRAQVTGLRTPPGTPSRAVPRRVSVSSSSGSDAMMELAEAAGEMASGNPIMAGLRTGAVIYNQFNPPQTKKRNMTINALSGRSAMKKSGQIKQKRSRQVIVSKGLAAKVKKVIEGQHARGIYISEGAGFVGSQYTPSNNTAFLGRFGLTTGDYAGQIKYFLQPGFIPLIKQALWFGGLINNINSSNIPENSSDLQGHPMIWFLPKEIVHVASILFNGKSQIAGGNDWDYNNVAGNFFTEGAELTATPDGGSYKGLKIFVKNSFVEMKFQNTCNRKVKITLYHCTPKRKFISASALNHLYDCIGSESGLAAGIKREGTNKTYETNAAAAINALLYDHNFEPKVSPMFNAAYDYQRVELFIAPGETMVTQVQGPKNATIDFTKFYDTGVGGGENSGGKYGTMAPGCGVHTLIKMEYDDQLFDNTNGIAASTNWVVCNQSNLGDASGPVDQYVYAPVIVSYKKFYEVKSPEITGGYKLSGASQRVILNNKKPAYHFNQITPGVTRNVGASAFAAKLTYAFDEENPAAPLTGGIAEFL